MLKSITGKIESCVIKKEGVTNNRPWKIYSITINGENFSTFDAKYVEKIGQEGTYEYEEKNSPDGQYVNKTLSKCPETNQVTTSTNTPDIIRGLGILRGDIQHLRESMEMRLHDIDEAIKLLNKPEQIVATIPQPTAVSTPQEEQNFVPNNNSVNDIPIIN